MAAAELVTTLLFELAIPPASAPGSSFQASINGSIVSVTVPPHARPGEKCRFQLATYDLVVPPHSAPGSSISATVDGTTVTMQVPANVQPGEKIRFQFATPVPVAIPSQQPFSSSSSSSSSSASNYPPPVPNAGSWNCKHCTYANEGYAQKCGVCDLPRAELKKWKCHECAFDNDGDQQKCIVCDVGSNPISNAPSASSTGSRPGPISSSSSSFSSSSAYPSRSNSAVGGGPVGDLPKAGGAAAPEPPSKAQIAEQMRAAEAERQDKELKENLEIATKVDDAFNSGPPVAIPFSLINEWTTGEELGKGGFGSVYKGIISYRVSKTIPGTGRFVAIKRVDSALITGKEKDVRRAVEREINVLGVFRSSPNIIRLIGYCCDVSAIGEVCLVYELAALGDLMHYLLTKPRDLLWQTRIRIAIGIATGLNFLHSSNPSSPAFHRDIKSSNVVLTQDFTPKIIDCGLSKFAPDGAAGSAFGATLASERFGTPGYMCPDYVRSSTMPYDAKCDIFSLGVVLLEILSGCQQGDKGVFLEDKFASKPYEVDREVRDEWPTSCVDDIVELALECTSRDRSKRRGNTTGILKCLQGISERHCTLTLSEAMLMERYKSTLAELEKLKGVAELVEKKSKITISCPYCYCDSPETESVVCSNITKKHTICKDCFNNMVSTQTGNNSDFTNNGRDVICSECVALNPKVFSPYDPAILATSCTPVTFSKYISARDIAIEREKDCKHQADLERMEGEKRFEMLELQNRYEQDEKKREEATVEQHRAKIVNDYLSIKCPHCRLTVLDFEGCFSVKHEAEYKDNRGVTKTIGCAKFFCGWCMAPFNNSSDCHAHVKQCPRSFHPGSYFGKGGEFNKAQAAQRKDKILAYMQQNDIYGEIRQKLYRALRKDLRDVEIDLEK